MSDTKETKKKGFFSKLLGRSDAVDANKEPEKPEDLKGSAPKSDNDSETSSACLLYTSPSPRDPT